MELLLCNWMTEIKSICWIIANLSRLALCYSFKHTAECVCLILPTHCLLPLNQPRAAVSGELSVTEGSATWLPSVQWEGAWARASTDTAFPEPSAASLSHPALTSGCVVPEKRWNHSTLLPKNYLHLLCHSFTCTHVSESHLSLRPTACS